MFEHLDQFPLFINDVGMSSKLIRYIVSDKKFPLGYFKYRPKGMGETRHMGYYGQQAIVSDPEKIPLIGKFDPREYQGLT